MSDWEDFRAEVTWGISTRVVRVGSETPARQQGFVSSDQFRRTFPFLMELLSKARVTRLETSDGRYQLFGWNQKPNGTCGWLAPLPVMGRPIKPELHADHRALLECFGGVLETWNQPQPNMLVGVTSALTEDESGIHPDDWYAHYLALCDQENMTATVLSSDDHAVFVVEGNSNRILYHRTSGAVIYFAPDPAPHLDVKILDGAPEYSLYQIIDVPHFVAWVEALARQWLDVTS